MKGVSFSRTLTRGERIAGLIYYAFHVLALPLLLNIAYFFLSAADIQIQSEYVNLIYYGIGFVAVLIILHHFLIDNFDALWARLIPCIGTMLLGLLAYYSLNFAVSFVIDALFGSLSNPNNESVMSMVEINLNVSIVTTVLLGPLVEECLYRGILFTAVGKRSRFLGYAVSSGLFALSHVYISFFAGFDPRLFITAILYLPSGLVFCWMYERSKSVFCCVFTHMTINALAIWAASVAAAA